MLYKVQQKHAGGSKRTPLTIGFPDCDTNLRGKITCWRASFRRGNLYTNTNQNKRQKMAKQIANPDLPAPPSGKYPAKAHARRVAKWLAENGGPKEGVIYLEGQALREHEV